MCGSVHLMWRVDSLEKTLMLGGIGGRRRRDNRGWDGWMASLTRWTWVSELRELVMDREAWRAAIHGVSKSRTWLSDWSDLIWSDTQIAISILKVVSHHVIWKMQRETMRYHCQWPKYRPLTTTNAGEDVKPYEFSFIADRNTKQYSHFGRQFGNIL